MVEYTELSPEQQRISSELEREEFERTSLVVAGRREHELHLQHNDLAMQKSPLVLLQRVLIGLVKLPVLMILAITLPIAIINHVEIPSALLEFLRF